MNFKANQGAAGSSVTDEQLMKDVTNNKRDIDKFGVDLGQLMIDYKGFKEAMNKNVIDQASALQMEVMLSKVEAKELTKQLQKVIQGNSENDKLFKDKIQKFLQEGDAAANPEVDEARRRQID